MSNCEKKGEREQGEGGKWGKKVPLLVQGQRREMNKKGSVCRGKKGCERVGNLEIMYK